MTNSTNMRECVAVRNSIGFRFARLLPAPCVAPTILLARTTFATFATIAILLPSSSARAQDAVDPFVGVEEMIVTGSDAAALLAPSSTAAISFDASDLDNYQVEDVSDLAAYVPNLEIRSQNATNASFFIRGVGLQDFGANASSSVPIFQDGVPRNPSATQLVGLFDIGGLSVLKGPQGSGNYRNSSAGAFLVKTQGPAADFSGFATANVSQIYSVDARDASRYNFELGQNFAVFEEIVSARISARYGRELPFWENGCANRLADADRALGESLCGENVRPTEISAVTPFLERYIGDVNDFGFRGQIRVQPPSIPLDVTVRVGLSRLNRDSTAGQHTGTSGRPRVPTLAGQDSSGYIDPDVGARVDAVIEDLLVSRPDLTRPRDRLDAARAIVGEEIRRQPLDNRPFRGDLDISGRTILETHEISTTATLDLDNFDVAFNAGFIDYRKSEQRDTDLSPNVRFPSSGNDQAWEAYGDLTFSGEEIGDLPVQWSVGGYSLIEQVEASQVQSVFGSDRTTSFEQEIYSFGVFAEGRYEILEAITLAAGIRYNWEQKDFDISLVNIDISSNAVGSRNQRTWDAVTGFAEFRYDFTEEIGTYLKYSKGFKAGHFNPSRPTFSRVPDDGFADPEEIDSIEWGLNYTTWSGRLKGGATLFFYNYKNYQVFRLTSNAGGIFRTVENAQRARNFGAEIDFNVSPLEGIAPEPIERLNINLSFGWLETTFVEFITSEERPLGNNGSFGVDINYSGNNLISAPNLQVALTVTWPLGLGNLGTLTPQYDVTWTDDTPFGPNNGRGELDANGESRFSPFTIGNRAYALHNVRLTWEPPGDSSIRIGGYCRNLADQRYTDFAVDISTFSSQILQFVSDPRICGADVRFSW